MQILDHFKHMVLDNVSKNIYVSQLVQPHRAASMSVTLCFFAPKAKRAPGFGPYSEA